MTDQRLQPALQAIKDLLEVEVPILKTISFELSNFEQYSASDFPLLRMTVGPQDIDHSITSTTGYDRSLGFRINAHATATQAELNAIMEDVLHVLDRDENSNLSGTVISSLIRVSDPPFTWPDVMPYPYVDARIDLKLRRD